MNIINRVVGRLRIDSTRDQQNSAIDSESAYPVIPEFPSIRTDQKQSTLTLLTLSPSNGTVR